MGGKQTRRSRGEGQRERGSTSRDVARQAGVSQATVSRVLHGSPLVTPATRDRVLQAMEEAGYRPNLVARAMRTQRTGTIGVLVDQITSPFYPEVVEALSTRLASEDFRMILWTSGEAGEIVALESIQQGLVDGVVFTSLTGRTSALSEALRRRAPFVLLNRGLAGLNCDQVMSDNYGGGAQVATYFLQAQRNRMACISVSENASTAREREQGFGNALQESSRALGPDALVRGDFTHDVAYAAAHRLLSQTSRPNALFCVNDATAMGAVDAARSLGVRIPDDLWVVGYDDIAMSSWESYDLTTVRQPITEMVDRSVSLLLERLDHPKKSPETVRFPSKLIVRGSTGHASYLDHPD